jgi:hypothetical protein
MSSSSLIKVVAAFVTGVLVALVGALTYVKMADRSPSEPVKTASAVEKRAPVLTHPDPAPAPAAEDEPQPAETLPKPVRHNTLSPVGHKFVHRSTAEPVAQVTPAPDPLPPNPYSTSDTNPVRTEPAEAPRPAVQEHQPEPAMAQAPAPARQAQSATLESGTSLVIRLNEALSTEHNYTGDTFRGTLDAPVIVNGFIIADKGSKALGRIVTVQKAGRVQGQAGLTLALTEINTTDGQRVQVQTSSFDKKGGSNTGRDAAKVAGGAALGAIIGAIAGGGKGAGIGAGVGGAAGAGDVLLTRGKAAVIPNETVLTFRLSAPVTITEKLN